MRKAFTLIEMMISVTILSIMMIFLYKSYASLNNQNRFYKKELSKVKLSQVKKRVIYLDFLNRKSPITIINKNKDEDFIFFKTAHSLHRLYNPYIAYIVNDSKLYRIESLKEIKPNLVSLNAEYISDSFGDINIFKVYKSDKNINKYLINMDGVILLFKI